MTPEEALAAIKEIMGGPRGHGDAQVAVWYEKLRAIDDVVDQLDVEPPGEGN